MDPFEIFTIRISYSAKLQRLTDPQNVDDNGEMMDKHKADSLYL